LQQTGATKLALSKLSDTHLGIIGNHLTESKNLPTDIHLLLLELCEIPANIKPPAPAKPAPGQKEGINNKAAWCLAQCHPLKKKPATMEIPYAQASTMLQLMKTYSKANPTFIEKKQRCAATQVFEVTRKMKTNGWLPQQELRNKIALQQ